MSAVTVLRKLVTESLGPVFCAWYVDNDIGMARSPVVYSADEIELDALLRDAKWKGSNRRNALALSSLESLGTKGEEDSVPKFVVVEEFHKPDPEEGGVTLVPPLSPWRVYEDPNIRVNLGTPPEGERIVALCPVCHRTHAFIRKRFASGVKVYSPKNRMRRFNDLDWCSPVIPTRAVLDIHSL